MSNQLDKDSTPKRVVIYTRVSTDEQAERQTIEYQRDFLRNFAKLYDLTVVAEYSDEGVSGTIPLSQRPNGHLLIKDSQYGRFDCVILYRVDRLGRSLTALLDAFNVLESANITIRSVTEPFDTATPIGKFLFQLLGSLAELEKSTIVERMTLGRDRVLRDSVWLSGPIPFGYDVDAAGCLIPSERQVEGLPVTEAEIARDLFRRLAAGSSATHETQHLNTMGVPTTRRYRNGRETTGASNWGVSRVISMINNTVYIGKHVFKSQHGTILRDFPALIDEDTWKKAKSQLTKSKHLPKSNAKRVYLLRGMITCGNCGGYFVGTSLTRPSGKRASYYRCGNNYKKTHLNGTGRCQAKYLHVNEIEGAVWSGCCDIIRNPQEALNELQRKFEARLGEADKVKDARDQLSQALLNKDQEKERILTVFRRGHISLNELESQLEDIHNEEGELQTQLSALDAQRQVTDVLSDHYKDAQTLLDRLRGRLDEIEISDDPGLRHQIISRLVSGIQVTTDTNVRPKSAHVLIRYTIGSSGSADSNRLGSTR